MPDITTKVQEKQIKQKNYHDMHAKQRNFEINDKVFVKNFRRGDPWLQGNILEITGPLSYKVKLSNDCIVRRHVDHIRRRETEDISETELEIFLPKIKPYSDATTEGETSDRLTPENAQNLTQSTKIQENRYPTRPRKKPAYLKDFQC
jgi:hypothetical protein